MVKYLSYMSILKSDNTHLCNPFLVTSWLAINTTNLFNKNLDLVPSMPVHLGPAHDDIGYLEPSL